MLWKWMNKCQFQLIDTAQQYKTESGVGEGIKRAIQEGLVERKDLFVTTKYPPKDQSMEEVVSTTGFRSQFTNLSHYQVTFPDSQVCRREFEEPAAGLP